MEDCAEDNDGQALSLWIEKLSDMVERQHGAIAATGILTHQSGWAGRLGLGSDHSGCPAKRLRYRMLLTTTKVMMRDRRGIHELLSIETLELFLSLAECAGVAIAEDALKCVINSVYSRPEFVRDHALKSPTRFVSRLLQLTTRAAPATFHWVAWRALLVACEANETIQALVYDITTWKHIHSTLHVCLHGGAATNTASVPFPSGQGRLDLFLEIIKLVAVLVNDLKLTPGEVHEPRRLDATELLTTLQPLGGLLLQTLTYTPPHMSPYAAPLIDLKNKVMEIFLFIPTELLGFFVQQQHQALSAILAHLYTMLVLVRIEKTRLAKDLQPVLMACHHLTTTGDPGIRSFFKSHIFPTSSPGATTMPSPTTTPAPPAFFHKHLTFFLTSLDTTVKRCMGEWLYLLCDQNADEYTRRTGLGNAIGLLRIKGLA